MGLKSNFEFPATCSLDPVSEVENSHLEQESKMKHHRKNIIWRSVGIAFIYTIILIIGCSIKEPISVKHERGSIVGIVHPIEIEAIVIAEQGIVDVAKTKTDTTGYFGLKNLKGGIYNLIVTAPSYGKYVKTGIIVYENGVTAIEDVYLKPMPEQIVEINPRNGASDHPLKKALEIIFAGSMDELSVEKAFHISPDLNGKITWSSNSKYFSFMPKPQFRANTEYKVDISTDAKTIYGDTLSFGYTFSFQTEDVVVVRTNPYNGAKGVNTGSNLTIEFNSAMDKNSVENAISIQPDILGDFIWNSDESVVFNPGTYMLTQTTYVIAIDTTAVDIFGSQLSKSHILTFETEPLSIVSYYPQNGATHVNIGTHVVISFNSEMDQNSVGNAFSISPNVEGSIIWDNYYQFRFKPATGFANNIQYEIQVNVSCRDKGGKNLPRNFKMVFTTAP